MTSATAVLIALPRLDEYTRRWRSVSFSSDYPDLPLSERVPPHITVLVPWVLEPDRAALDRLAEAVHGFGPFDLTFPTAERFPDGVVYLRPEPYDELRALLRSVTAAFPEHPPYGGAIADPDPHLTVAADGDDTVLEDVRATLAAEPPPPVHVEAVTTWASPDQGLWHQTNSIPFA